MPTVIVIPDDYQQATQRLHFLSQDPHFVVTSLGDLARDSSAATALAEAKGLILIRERTIVDDHFLRQMPQLKIISQTGKIARHIDLDLCTQRGVAVVEGTGSPIAPAELAWLLIMAARRQLVLAVNDMRAGHWQTNIGRAVAGQTLGIMGYGKIGKRIARYAQAFDMSVQVWGTARAREEAQAAGLKLPASREEFFATSDIVTLHQRLVPENRGNITLNDLSAMRPDALFVNTSRAELVVPGALLTALHKGRPGYAALDVYEDEPLYQTNNPLLSLPQVLCTPHLGYVEEGSYQLYFQTAFNNIQRFFNGDYSHVINPRALTQRP